MEHKVLLSGLLKYLDKGKAENIQVYDVKDFVSYTDHVIILTALSGAHVKALVHQTKTYFQEQGVKPFIHTRKQDNCQWAVLDYRDIVIHYFQNQEREFYQLDAYFQKIVPNSNHYSFPNKNYRIPKANSKNTD